MEQTKELNMELNAKPFEGQKEFKFYTYDHRGHDCDICVYAESIDEAWERFDRIYGKDRPVDYVKEVV